MISVGSGRLGRFIVFIMLLWISLAASEDPSASAPSWDWLGTGPVFSHTTYYSPYYYNYASPVYANPYLYYMPYYNWPYLPFPSTGRYYTNYELSYPWWVGTHENLPKVLEIAKTSSVRIYSNGAWRSL